MVMTLSALFLRTLGMVFNAFVTRKLGADGVGLFTLIMSIYGLSVTVAASGINLAATRMCAEAIGSKGEGELSASLKRCALYALLCGVFAMAALIFGAAYISESWLGDERCELSLKLLAVSLPFIALSNVLHGYFTAVRKAPKSAVVQIFEQFFKIAVTVFGLLCLFPDISRVTDEYRHIEYACAIIVGGGAAAEVASFAFALILFIRDRAKMKKGYVTPGEGKRLTKELFGITVPVAAAAYVRSGLSTLEHILIPKGLRANPISADTALASYGVLCGMAMPVIMFPTALLYSFTGLLIPEFSSAKVAGEQEKIRHMASRALGLTLIYSMGCGAFIWLFSGDLGSLIYDSPDAGRFIRLMAPLIPLMYLDHAVDAMLKGLGEQLYCMKVNIVDSALCASLVYFLCSKVGIYGYIITIYAAETLNVTLSLGKFIKVSGFRADVVNRFVKPLGAALAVVAVFGIFPLGGGVVAIFTGGMLCASAYALLLTLSGSVTEHDILWATGIFKK